MDKTPPTKHTLSVLLNEKKVFLSREYLSHVFITDAGQAGSSVTGASDSIDTGSREGQVDRKTLQNIRVVQRNLIYVIGIPPSIASEEVKTMLLFITVISFNQCFILKTLRRADYFGQYGRIVKVVVNRNHSGIDTSSASASAYITFAHKVLSIPRHTRPSLTS